MKRFVTKIPILTVVLSAIAVLIHVFDPLVGGVLEWRADLWGSGELWRWVTGHLGHWGARHLVWDLAMFALLGAVLEPRCRGRFLATLLLTTVLTDLLFRVGGEFERYRGLSGWAVGLFALAMLELVGSGLRQGRLGMVLLGAAGWMLLLAKVAFEWLTGEALFASGWGDASFIVAVEAHLAGALAPVIILLFLLGRKGAGSKQCLGRVDPDNDFAAK